MPYRSRVGEPRGPAISPMITGLPGVSTSSAVPPASSISASVASAVARTPSPVALTEGVRQKSRMRSR